MPPTPPTLEHLMSMTATLNAAGRINGGPLGDRVIVAVTGGSFEGKRLRGSVVPGSGGDWVTLRPDGSFKLDVRVTLQTEDGADIYVTYNGIGVPGAEGEGPILRTAPLFETGDARYAWLNRIQAVGAGTSGGGSVSYEVYALVV